MKTVAILANTKRTFHNLNLEKQVNTLEREGEEREGRGGREGSREREEEDGEEVEQKGGRGPDKDEKGGRWEERGKELRWKEIGMENASPMNSAMW